MTGREVEVVNAKRIRVLLKLVCWHCNRLLPGSGLCPDCPAQPKYRVVEDAMFDALSPEPFEGAVYVDDAYRLSVTASMLAKRFSGMRACDKKTLGLSDVPGRRMTIFDQ